MTTEGIAPIFVHPSSHKRQDQQQNTQNMKYKQNLSEILMMRTLTTAWTNKRTFRNNDNDDVWNN